MCAPVLITEPQSRSAAFAGPRSLQRMADSKISKVSDSSLLIAAMSYRVKYRKLDCDGRPIKLHLRVEGCGVHKMNRGGVYPAGVACMRLCDEVLRAGFLKEEVNHAGVAVEEIPIAEVPRRIGESLVRASVYNAAQCALDELLAPCFEAPYGTVFCRTTICC